MFSELNQSWPPQYLCPSFSKLGVPLRLRFLYPSLNSQKTTKGGDKRTSQNERTDSKEKKKRGMKMRVGDYWLPYTRSQEKLKPSDDKVDPKIHLLKVTLSGLEVTQLKNIANLVKLLAYITPYFNCKHP